VRAKERGTVEDESVIDRINELTHQEQELYAKEAHGQGTEEDREQLREIGVMLDQCWDLLHQRRARRSAGMDPNEAKVRDEKTVEGYVD
jgi:hypothetical protein